MTAAFKIKMTTSTMYNFLMYHMYHGFGGIFSIIIGIALIGYSVYVGDRASNNWIYMFFGVIFLVYEPTTLYTRAAKQIKASAVFKEPLQYVVSEEGIKISQGETFNVLPWEKIYKVRENAQSIFVYTNTRNAIIWEKNQMGTNVTAVKKMINSKVPAVRRKLKG